MFRPFLLLFVSFCCVYSLFADSPNSQNVSALEKYENKYAGKLEKLAVWCDENDLPEQAEKTRKWVQPDVNPDEISVSPLLSDFWELSGFKQEKASKSRKNKTNRSTPFAEWEKQFRDLRAEASVDFLKFAKKNVSDGNVSFGFSLLMRALHENPDNPNARKILGYQKTKTGWQTDFEKMQIKAGNVWHEKFGWIPKKGLKKYENGQRFYNGQWVSAEQDVLLHSDIEKGWVIETGHFQIITDASLEEGVACGQKLEKFYRVWKQLFLNYYATEKQIRSLFENETAKFTPIPRHRVLLFKTAEEYNTYLSAKNMLVPGSVGVYVHRTSGEGVACFVAGEEDDSTMYHEITHQLFEESCKTNPKNGENQNFWAIEAVSTFMESYHEAEDGSLVVGDFNTDRLKSARILAVNQKEFIPFEEFVKVNRAVWQNSPQVLLFYAQACGMAHFLVFYEHGKYRDALGHILFDVYSGTDSVETLIKYTGTDWETLNKEYQEYISRDSESIKGYMVRVKNGED